MQERIPFDDISVTAAWPNHMARYQFALPYVQGKRVLDAGSGNGYGAALLKAQGKAAKVVSIDVDEASINHARECFGSLGVEYVLHDCEKLEELKAQFDVIISFENIEHLQHPEAFVFGAANVLADDGVMVISTPDRDSTPPFVSGRPANPFHTFEWYAEEFDLLLAGGFSSVEMLSQVISYAQQQLKDAERVANENFSRLEAVGRYSGLVRLRRLLGGVPAQYVKPAMIAIPRMEDYPIVARETAALYGAPFCHVAICRK
jgi:SAM-dependent methyltransferase